MPDPLDQPLAARSADASNTSDGPEGRVDTGEVDERIEGIKEHDDRESSTALTDESGDGRGDDRDDGLDEPGAKKGKKPRSRTRTIVEWVAVIAAALLVARGVRSWVTEAFWIPSPSMEPTLEEGDRVLVNKLSYRLHDVHRGDIIVFERPEDAISANPDDDISDLIKRVIGLPGDIIESRPDGFVYIDGHRLDEPYLPPGTRTANLVRQEVPDDEIFVMGDNRGNSSDSREFGTVDEDLIVGRAFVRWWPLDDIGDL